MSIGLLESGPLHTKKVKLKDNVTHLQEVIKNLYGKGLGVWVGPRGPSGGPHWMKAPPRHIK